MSPTSPVVRVAHLRLTSRIAGLDERGLRIVERAIPSSGRSRGDLPGEIVVTANRATAAVEALRRAGILVEETGGEQS